MSTKVKREVRLHSAPQHRVSIRANSDGSKTAFGYFATFGTVSHDLGGFREVIARGAFADSLKVNPVRCLRDHAPEMLLGRTESSTLTVSEDTIGLRFSVNLPKGVSYADDLAILLARGDAFENSFAFSVDGPDGETWTETADGAILRTLKRCILFEGSILTGNPAAYPNTSVDLRACPVQLRLRLKNEGVNEDDPSVGKNKKKRSDFDYDDDDLVSVCDPDDPAYDADFDAAGYCDQERQRKATIALSLRRLRQS